MSASQLHLTYRCSSVAISGVVVMVDSIVGMATAGKYFQNHGIKYRKHDIMVFMGSPHGELASKAVDAILEAKETSERDFVDMVDGINRSGCGFKAVYIEDMESSAEDIAWLKGYIAGKENNAEKARDILETVESVFLE